MGVFSYVVFANREDAQALLDGPSPLERFEGYGEKASDPGRWASLATLLGAEPDEAARIRNATPLAEAEGSWVFEVPTELLERVSRLDAARIAKTGRAWAEADIVMARGGGEYARNALSRLVSASRRALAENKRILVLSEL